MSGVYRSKSYRRYDDNSPITKLIEKDNTTILATASAQLFISAPHIERWYKSSTGTICFLKNFLAKTSYYFRLYSLMQGKLWEQEMESSFEYVKASSLFHYLTLNRFNYGFKFVCEDEAEHFYNVIRKFSAQIGSQQNQTYSLDTKAEQMVLNDAVSKTLSQVEIQEKTDDHQYKFKIRTRQSRLDKNIKKSTSSEVTSKNGDTFTIESQAHDKIVQTPRRYASSSDRGGNRANSSGGGRYLNARNKKTIDKSDISCPFRCSCVDLSGTGVGNENGEIFQRGSTEIIKKYSTVVKELAYVQKSIPLNSQANKQQQQDLAITRIMTARNHNNLIGHMKLYESINAYINKCGGLQKFEQAQEKSESERNKFNAFLAASIPIAQSLTKSAANINRSTFDVSTASISNANPQEFLDFEKLEIKPCAQSPKIPSTLTHAAYLKSALKTPNTHQQGTPATNINLLTPPKSAVASATVPSYQQQMQPSQLLNTPITPTIKTNQLYNRNRVYPPSLSPPHKTVKSAVSIAAFTHTTSSQNVSRISRIAASSAAADLDVPPPKPPRRSSLRINH